VSAIYRNGAYRATDCPLCQQEVRIDTQHDGFVFTCRGGHADEELRPQLPLQVMLELAASTRDSAPSPPDEPQDPKGESGSTPVELSETGSRSPRSRRSPVGQRSARAFSTRT
jgi:hypothetical protein